MDIGHINIRVPSGLLNNVKDFYSDVFDLRVGPRPNFTSVGYWLYSNNRPIIHLSESNQHFENDKQGYFDHVAFTVEDIELIVENLKSMGIAYQLNTTPQTNMTQIFFKDLCGLGVEASQNRLV